MRIGMVTACYKPVINGVTRMVSLYKQRLEAAGYEVTVFTLGEPDPAGEEPGVVRSPALPLGETGYYFTFGYSKAAQQRLQEMDMLHCHHLFMGLEMAHRYGRAPIVYTNHTRYDLYSGTYMPLPQPAADALMRQVWPDYTDFCDVVVTPSHSVRQVMQEFGVRRPIEVIANGVEREAFLRPARPRRKADLGLPDAAIVAVYVGRLSPEKNLETLLRQFAVAQELVPALRLALVGRGPLREELGGLAAELEVAHTVRFTGALPYDEIPNVLAAADLFVTASVSEVHPLTIIEAMAAGLPVAAIASPGISDTVVSGETGLLTSQPRGGLAAAIVALVANPARLREMGAAARTASERYDIGRTVDETVALYERLRDERPDLRRQRGHGRWRRTGLKLRPVVEQLAGLLRPPE